MDEALTVGCVEALVRVVNDELILVEPMCGVLVNFVDTAMHVVQVKLRVWDKLMRASRAKTLLQPHTLPGI